MNSEREETAESRFSPNLRLFNSRQYSQNEHIVSILIGINYTVVLVERTADLFEFI